MEGDKKSSKDLYFNAFMMPYGMKAVEDKDEAFLLSLE